MNNKVKEIDIIDWKNKKVVDFLKKNKEVVVLIQEESCYYIIPKINLVIEDWSSRYDRGTIQYTIQTLINEFSDE